MKYEKPTIQDMGVIGDHTFTVIGNISKGGPKGPRDNPGNDPFGEGSTGDNPAGGGS